MVYNITLRLYIVVVSAEMMRLVFMYCFLCLYFLKDNFLVKFTRASGEKLLVWRSKETCGCILLGKLTRNCIPLLFLFRQECVEWLLVLSYASGGRLEQQLLFRWLNLLMKCGAGLKGYYTILYCSILIMLEFVFSEHHSCSLTEIISISYTTSFSNLFVSVLQSQCRKYLARLHYMQMKKAAITTQCAWRARSARLELRKLKMVSTSFFIVTTLSCLIAYF